MKKLLLKLKTPLLIVAAVLVVAAMLTGYALYISTVKKSISDDTASMLNALSTQGVSQVHERILADIKNIQVRADAVSVIGDFTSQEMYDFIVMTSQNDTKSSRVILSDLNGDSITSDGMHGNLGGNATIQKALAGEAVLSKVDSEQMSPDENVVMISVPVKSIEGNIIGALSCVYMAEVYGEMMNINDLSHSGQYCVVSSNARFIMQHEGMTGAELTTENSDITDEGLALMKENMQKGDGGTITAQKGNYISYLPIGINDWYLVSFFPKEQIDGETVETYSLVVLVTTVVIVLLIALFIVLTLVQQRMRRHLAHQVYYDSMTGLPNEAKLKQFYENLLFKGAGYVYLHLNVSDFQRVISIFGYDTGNNILKAIATALNKFVGLNEIAAKLRDDSFALIIKYNDDTKFAARLKTIMESLEKIEATDGATVFAYNCTFSCGTYSLTGEEENFEYIANMARFTSTLMGNRKSDVIIYTNDQLQETLKLRNRLLPDAPKALEENQILAYMQPKYDINTMKITAAETFARWHHPELGVVQPGEFLSVLELSGNILELDLYIFEEACKLMKKWIEQEQMPVPLSVNISPFNFYEVNFVDKINDIVKRNNVPSCLMCLEIDQKALISHEVKAVEIMETFHDNDFILTVDNFGDDIVPMDIFYNFTFDILNLSPKFIQRARDDEGVRNIFKAVVSLAKQMNIIVSAEGVELYEQEDFLKEMECEMVQGFLYSIPQPREEFEKLIF